ncbi:MAG: hypothetical protein GF383_09120 [Candidatus Lokiarchaeota archaeon]|nr:hypothetical protein [Candidatus Lokiarchaeota archaeon]MBD3340623.1 hypothetical protein [Candidatus Lokiarchaeota archaeon]
MVKISKSLTVIFSIIINITYLSMKKILFIARADHLTHPTIKKFLALSSNGKYIVKFVVDEQFFDIDLTNTEIICLKSASAYNNKKIWKKIQEFPSIRVINSLNATQICRNRMKINLIMEELSIPIPKTAYNLRDFLRLKSSIIVKNKLADEHEIQIYSSQESILVLDFEKNIYQEFIPNDGFDYKYYGIGEKVFALRKRASQFKHHKEKVSENRQEIRPDPNLIKFVKRLKKKLTLDIYGIDFIKANDQKYYAIDVNLFPGLIGIEGIAIEWLNYFESILNN